MNNQVWGKDIKPFEWEELDGKTLKIRAGKHEGAMVVVGYDPETKDVFVLHEEIEVPTIKPGDKVKHSEHGIGVYKGVHSFREHEKVICKFDKNVFDRLVNLSDLEVVE